MNNGCKRVIAVILLAALLISAVPMASRSVQAAAAARQMEALNRGLVAVSTDGGVFLSWRLLGTESYDTAFNVYRNGTLIASNITNSTNYLDASGSAGASYMVRSVVSGSEVTQSDPVTPWGQNYLDVPLQKPADTTLDGTAVTYAANDATVADVDGDGAYEIILKWDPSNAKDNSQSGYTSNVYVDCYEMDGTLRWRIDLGKNIRAGAHYTQIIAYDLNGDGKAEVAMKTADGTVDGQGSVIGDASADYRNSSGYILSGPEYLTLFEGKTGKELVTIDYNPARGTVSSWGDSYGNRVDRFLAGVAYFDGKTPSLIVCRGYYTRCVIVSYEYKGGTLNEEWVFDSNDSGNSAYAGEGNHNLSIADVDGDGCDEVIYGSAVIDNDGTGLYATGNGHGDALHVGDFDPTRDGLEIFQVHEETDSSIESIQFRDAKTGNTIWSKKLSKDIGRGLILNIDPDFYPYVTLAASGNYYTAGGEAVTSSISGLGINFASYWDGDLYREGLDGTTIRKWDYENDKVVTALTGADVHSCNGTKSTPSLSGDILGDWREEVIWPTSDDTALRIYTTTDVTDAKLYTLMHDSQYRSAIAWQNVGYNQPPHTSYYIGPDMDTPTQPSLYTVGSYTLAAPDGSGSTDETTATTPTTGTVTSGSYVHNFTQSGTSSSFYTITGSLSTSKGSTTYNGETLTQCLKMESSTTITFNAPESGTLTLVFGGTTSADGSTVKIDGVKQTISGETITVDVAAGDHTVTKGDTINLFYMVYTSDSAAGGETEATTAPTEAHSHSYTSSVTTAATCGAAGVMTYTCSCGDSYTEAIAATGSHSYSDGVCTVCGAADPSYVAPTDPTEPSVTAGTYAHNFTENGTSSSFYTITGNLSTGKGSTTYNGETLTQCLKMESSTTITFNAPADGTLTLVFGGTTSADGSTVKIDGVKQTISGETITVDVAAGDHTVTKGDSINLFYMVYTANSTGEEHSHSYAPVVTAPTCTEQGYTTYTCSCGDSYVSDYAAATGHSYESVTVDATCTEDGSITYTCACGDTYSEPIPAAGHSYTAVVTAPTCTDQGYTTYTCPACGDSYAADYVSAAGHSYETSVTAPGCETQGYTTHTCPACGDSYTDSYTDALRHSYNAGGICVNCGEEDPNALPPLYLFTIAGNSMSVGNDLSMYFFVERADVADGSYYMQITKTYADGREDVVKTIPMSSWLASGDYYLVAFNGIAAKEMGDNVIATACNADGTAASYTMVTSVVDYAMTKLNEGGNSAQLNTLLADMLNYGAAAQAEFSYDTENPANAMMSEEQKGYATAQFDMSTLNVTAVDGAAGMGVTMSLKSSIVLNVFLDPAQVTTDMTAKISYTNHNGRAVSYEIAGSKFTQLGSYYLYLNVDTLAASDIETVVTVEIYDGETLVSTSQYNMAGYCANNANKDIAVSLAKFCTSAHAYFHP